MRNSNATVVGLFVLLLATALVETSARLEAQSASPSAVTFTRDIAPIVQRACQNCHRPGGGAPMSLITYEDVRPWARAIKQKTVTREMPPWFIDHTIGIQKFKNDPSLTDDEISLISHWADAGAPMGDPAHMPPPRHFPAAEEWSIGTPDLVVSSPETPVEGVAPDWYGDPGVIPLDLAEDRYVKAVEVREVRTFHEGVQSASRRPGDLNLVVVHHAHVTVTKGAWDPNAPEDENEDAIRGNKGPFALTHELGQNAHVFPDEVGVKLPARSALIFYDFHLHSVGQPVTVRIDLAFKFYPRGYKPKYDQAADYLVMSGPNLDLDIPGGKETVVDAIYTVPYPVKLLTFEPHLHASGTRMCADALYPDGSRETLNCAGYNHNWVRTYNYEDDVAPLLPKGTVIHLRAWYNNTASNRRVVDSRNWKGWGQRSIDDMFYMLPRSIRLTEEEFKAAIAARAAKRH